MEKASQSLAVSSKLALAASLGLALCVAGCTSNTASSSSSSSSSSTTQQAAPTYMAPTVSGTNYRECAWAANSSQQLIDNCSSSGSLNTALVYSVDETNLDFQQTDYDTLDNSALAISAASFTFNYGTVAAGQRGLHTLTTSTSYYYQSVSSLYLGNQLVNEPTGWFAYTPTETSGFAVEFSGQAGGFVQLAGQPVAPVVNASQCPDSATHTYQFITIPTYYDSQTGTGWDPNSDTAYGSVDVSSSGSTVTFNNISQYTLGSVKLTPTVTSLPTGTCGSTYFGEVTNEPGDLTITDPGSTDPAQTVSAQAMIGIGASNSFLVEDEGGYNFLGAGTGAVGIAKPTSTTSAAVGEQYLGFIYGTGVYTNQNSLGITGQSSHLASFGFTTATLPANCNNTSFGVPTADTNMLFGGDYTNDVQSSSGYGNCDVAIDLGTEDSTNYGLYPNAKVYMGATYAANTTGSTDTFSAVAIAGTINGKYAIFLLGYDSTQPWAIYLLQSN
jgi:hypothetical protein